MIKGENNIFRGDFKVLSFGMRVCRADMKIFVLNFQKQISNLDSLRKNTQKKSAESELDEGDIADLKSFFFLENFMTMGKWK